MFGGGWSVQRIHQFSAPWGEQRVHHATVGLAALTGDQFGRFHAIEQTGGVRHAIDQPIPDFLAAETVSTCAAQNAQDVVLGNRDVVRLKHPVKRHFPRRRGSAQVNRGLFAEAGKRLVLAEFCLQGRRHGMIICVITHSVKTRISRVVRPALSRAGKRSLSSACPGAYLCVLCDAKRNCQESDMPRWLRVMRGMVGTGLTFAAGVGVVSAVVGTAGLLAGELTWIDLFRMVGKLSVVASFVGVVFSGVLAIVARRKSFDTLSLPFVTAVGAGGGLLYFLFIGVMNGFRVWSPPTAILNLALLLAMGGGAAAGTFLIGRRVGRALTGGEQPRSLGEGGMEAPVAQHGSAQTVGEPRPPSPR